MLETYLDVLAAGYFEVSEAFRGLADEHVWQRPAEGLLSIGEIAGHVAFWLTVRFTGDDKEAVNDPAKRHIESPLIDPQFRYYPATLATTPSDEHLAMTAGEVCAELLRVHREAVVYLKTLNPDLDACPPGYTALWTYREFVRYASIHVAYHTGQIYSARHLLGEAPPDN